jgi:SAM-dependent methyltransferase
MESKSEHWDSVFLSCEDEELGWYEKDVSRTMGMLEQVPDWRESVIFLSGAGTSLLIEELLSQGAGLVLNDISGEALNRVRNRLAGKSGIVWLRQDISRPLQTVIPAVGIWIDRAVLHFLTEESDIAGYFDNVRSALKTGGYAIFAEFASNGVEKCAGLPVHRYSVEELTQRLGPGFRLVSHFDYTYLNCYGGQRPYIYALYKREGL